MPSHGSLLAIAGLLLAAALLNWGRLPGRVAMLLAGIALLLLARSIGSAAAVVTTGLLIAVAVGQWVLLAIREGRLRFNAEEQRMAETVLASLSRRQARHLIDQGVWMDGKAGDVLTREGEPAGHLFYLGEGTAEVSSRGMWLATASAPVFVGEMTVLNESGASASVTIDSPARFWCVDGAKLRLFLRENPDIRVALENSFVGAIADKLRASNSAMVAARAGAA